MANKSLVACLLCVVAVQCIVVLADRYTSRYDNIDLETLLGNKRALNGIIKCLLEKGPCSPEGKELKSKAL
jgi:ABC-type antimicrobial peptide transport system ATPase subunit